MIWFTLALFAISFIAVALLTPKPEIEDARAQDLDPNSFPRATEDSPIPLVLGCVRQRAPNTLWYGGFRAEAQKEKVKTGLFSSKKVTTGYKYYLTFDLGICLGPASLCGEGIIPAGGGGTSGGSKIIFGSSQVASSGEYGLTLNTDGPSTIIDVAELDFETVNSDWTFTASHTVKVTRGETPRAATHRIFATPYTVDGVTSWPGGEPTAYVTVDSGSVTMTASFNVSGYGGAPITEIHIRGDVYPFSNFGTSVEITSPPFYQLEGAQYGYSVIEFTYTLPSSEGGNGGMILPTTVYPGTFDQPVDPCIEALVGEGNIPAYRGTMHAVFCDAYIGESPQLKKIQFQPAAYTTHFSTDFGGKLALDSDDINPAEAIYEILTNTWRGLGIDTALIDKDTTFAAAHSTLSTERHGCSVIVSSPKTGKQVLTEILRQIDGILRQNDQGLIELILIRDDYDASLLDIYDEDDIILVDNFTKTAWEDVRSQVKISFSDRTKEEAEGRVAVAQDMAVYGMIGRLSTANISFPFCYDAVLANQLAQRELNRLSIPLYRLTAQFNRNAYKLRAGDVIKINWSEYGFSELIMRVQKIDLGLVDKNIVIVEMVQDVFAITDTVFADPEDSLWDDTTPSPEEVENFEVTELPYFAATNVQASLTDGQAGLLVIPQPPTTESETYDLYGGDASGDANLLFIDPTEASYPPSGTLKAAYSATAGFTTGKDATGFVLENLLGPSWDAAFTTTEVRGLGGLLWADGEWMAYEAASTASGEVTVTNVYRGILGTTPKDHALGTRIYSVNAEMFGDGDLGIVLSSEGDTAYFKIVDRVGGLDSEISGLTERSYTIQDIANRPLRPRNLQIAASRATDQEIGSTHTVSWVPSNRAANQVTFENESAETPDLAETYELEVWIDGVKIDALDETGIAGNSTTVDLSAQAGAAGEIRVYARRTIGLKKSFYYAFIPFVLGNELLLSGDEPGKVLLSGDEQATGAGITLSGSS